MSMKDAFSTMKTRAPLQYHTASQPMVWLAADAL
jgi:hypothetical protein